MKQETISFPKTSISLEVELRIDPETWSSFQQLCPTAWHLLNVDPSIIAIELLMHHTPKFSISSSVVIGSPTAWILDDGHLLSAEDTAGPEHLSESLWRIGRECGFSGMGPWIQNQGLDTTSLLSILIFPNMICVRDSEILEHVAERTWTDSLREPIQLEARAYCPPMTGNMQNRTRAQIRHLNEIYYADLGSKIDVTKTTLHTKRELEKLPTTPQGSIDTPQ